MMRTDQQLHEALNAFLKERGKELSSDPLDSLVIPLSGGEQLEVPVVFLSE